MTLKDKVAIITGSGSGIGRETALLFAKEGAAVSVADVNTAGGEETVGMIRDAGGTADFIATDVSSASDVAELVGQTESRHGRLDIIYNNAGIDIAKPIVETTEEWTLGDQVHTCRFKGNTLIEISPPLQKGSPLYRHRAEKYKATKAPMKKVTRYVTPQTLQW